MGKSLPDAFSDGVIERAVGADRKGKLSVLLYLVAIAVPFWQPWIAATLYALVAAAWLVPDRRIERILANEET
ncbi:hypothetical protein [Caballeronia sp. INDeC2]|uniref:hypothetical protein n=1 Tax=Caballeronia sp. INDeC2 TaxID=2921747 RepID=UPI0020278E5E|nr:hypothetical protein [Caballeronia sp. INDeC2]